MIIAKIGDLHLTNKTPPSRIDDYKKAIFDKLSYIFLNVIADIYIILGDIFTKTNFPKDFLSEVIDFFRRYKDKKILVIYGNHDLPFNNIKFASNSPLGILISTGFVKNLKQLVLDNYKLYFYNYGELPVDGDFIGDESYKKIGIFHCYFGFGSKKEKLTNEIVKRFDYVFSGHDHNRREIKKIGNSTLVRVESLSRMTGAVEDSERTDVFIYTFDTNNGKINKVQVPCDVVGIFNKKYLEVKRELRLNKKENTEQRIDDFFQDVKLDSIHDVLKVVDNFDEKTKNRFMDIYSEVNN